MIWRFTLPPPDFTVKICLGEKNEGVATIIACLMPNLYTGYDHEEIAQRDLQLLVVMYSGKKYRKCCRRSTKKFLS